MTEEEINKKQDIILRCEEKVDPNSSAICRHTLVGYELRFFFEIDGSLLIRFG